MTSFGLLIFLIFFLINLIFANQCPTSSIFCLGLRRQSNSQFEESSNCTSSFRYGDCDFWLSLDYKSEGSFLQLNVAERLPSSPSDILFAFSANNQTNLNDQIIFGYKKLNRIPQTFVFTNDDRYIETLTFENELKDEKYHAMYADDGLDFTKVLDNQRIRSAPTYRQLKPFRSLPSVKDLYYTTSKGKVVSKVDLLHTSSSLWLIINTEDRSSLIEIKSEKRKLVKSQALYRSSSCTSIPPSLIQLLTFTILPLLLMVKIN